MALWIIALIALIAALYLARAFIVPLLFGILVSYTLRPIVDWLERYHIPRAAGAASVLMAIVGGAFWMTLSLSDDAAAMAEKLPDAARKLRQNLVVLLTAGPAALQHMQKAADELQGTAADVRLKSTGPPAAVPPESGTAAWLRDFLLAQSALLVTFTAQAPVVLLLATAARDHRHAHRFVNSSHPQDWRTRRKQGRARVAQ